MEVNNSCELNFGMIGTIKPVGNFTKNVGIRAMSIIETRCVDEEASLVTNFCLVYANIDCACELLALYTYQTIWSQEVLCKTLNSHDSRPIPTLAVWEK